MKRLLILFLVIGVLGIYGQTTEGEIQSEADTTQQADTIIKVDTIGSENLQIEGDTVSTIKDSLFTEEVKKDQQEIIEKKDNSVSCCLIGKNQPEQKSKWSFGVGYVGAYNYAGPDLVEDYFDFIESPMELTLEQVLTLYNYWLNGFELFLTMEMQSKRYFTFKISYNYLKRECSSISNLTKVNYNTVGEIFYYNKYLNKYTFSLQYLVFNNFEIGPELIFCIAEGQEGLWYYRNYPIDSIGDIIEVYSVPTTKYGLGCGIVFELQTNPLILYKDISMKGTLSLRLGNTTEFWNNSSRKDLWDKQRLEVIFTGINFGIQINWRN